MSQPVYGRIMNYRKGIRTQTSHECLVQFVNVESKNSIGNLIGKKVSWSKGNCTHIGKIVGLHGRNGVTIVKFKKGVPGQAIGANVELIN